MHGSPAARESCRDLTSDSLAADHSLLLIFYLARVRIVCLSMTVQRQAWADISAAENPLSILAREADPYESKASCTLNSPTSSR